ncbi:hypothetical protein RB195_023291 [Necator americanus]|uniref:Uncharacterized protein n=1 Tax=Necator americanus TaxID=51031 RepID=A0ABR1EIJ6_NECAM
MQNVQTFNYAASGDQPTAKLKHLFMDFFKFELECFTKVKAALYAKSDARLAFSEKRPAPYGTISLYIGFANAYLQVKVDNGSNDLLTINAQE